MNESYEGFSLRPREGLISAISAGFFFVLVGVLFITTPNLFDKILDFFGDFDILQIPNTQILWPAPANLGNHSVVYSAVERFSLVFGLLQIVILALRFVIRSPLGKIAETVSNFVFWLGTSYLIGRFLNETTTLRVWFVFWAAIIMLLGLSLIVRAIILAAGLTRRTTSMV